MANEWDIGDEPRLTATFIDVNGVLTTPTAAAIIVKKPDGTILSYVSSGFTSQGNWNASTNSPALADGTGTAGHYYTVNVAGVQTFGDAVLSFAVGDRIYYNGKVWKQLKNIQSTTLTSGGTGILYVDQYVTLAGVWWYAADGIGARSASENYFTVRSQVV